MTGILLAWRDLPAALAAGFADAFWWSAALAAAALPLCLLLPRRPGPEPQDQADMPNGEPTEEPVRI